MSTFSLSSEAEVELQQLPPFTTEKLLNRINMPIELLVFAKNLEHAVIIVVQVAPHYHRTLFAHNVEQLAFQLREKYAQEGKAFSIVEYRLKPSPQWWQWQIK